MAENTVSPEAAPPSPWVRTLLAAGAMVLAFLVAFWLGRQQVSAEFSAYKAEQEKVRQTSAVAAQHLRAENTALQGQVALLEGRRQLDLALQALDARNFGIAKQDLDQAVSLLGEAANAAPALDRERAVALHKELQAVQLTATEDFSGQRAQIVARVRQWDALIPLAAAGAPESGAAAAEPPG
jgi:hypothetical protein